MTLGTNRMTTEVEERLPLHFSFVFFWVFWSECTYMIRWSSSKLFEQRDAAK